MASGLLAASPLVTRCSQDLVPMNLASPLQEDTLAFQEDDGRMIAFRGGRVILVGREFLAEVKPGEVWRVRLHPRDTCDVAEPIERLSAPPAPPPRRIPVVSTPVAVPANGHPEPVRVAVVTKGPAMFQGMLVEPHNVIRPGERVAMFVDAANINAACRALDFWIDWMKARDYFLADGHFVSAFYHVADFGGEGNQHGFFEALANQGFIIRRKPVKVIRDSLTGETRHKANLDMEIAVDMFNTAETYDVAFLFSGDSDFERAIETLRSRGKRIYVVSSRATLSSELLFTADKPVFHIEDFRGILQRDRPAV